MEILFDIFISKIKEMKAGDFSILKVPTIIETTSCFSILDEYLDQKSKRLIVTDEEGIYYGLICPKDLVILFSSPNLAISNVFAKAKLFSNTTARDLANKHLPIVTDDDKVSRVAEWMIKYEATVLPRAREKDGPVEGLISIDDIAVAVRNIWKESGIDPILLAQALEREEDE